MEIVFSCLLQDIVMVHHVIMMKHLESTGALLRIRMLSILTIYAILAIATIHSTTVVMWAVVCAL